jgi:Transposase DDE domain
MTAARDGARDVRLDKREEQVLTGMVMTGSTVLRKLGGSRAGEIAAHRFLDHEGVSPETTIAAAAERTRAAARGATVLLVQDTTEINFSGADRSRSGLGPAGDGKALGFFIHPLLAVSLNEEAVLGIAHAQIWSRAPTPVPDRKRRPIEDKESGRWLDATAAAASFVGVAAEVIDVSDREGDIYQHFARRPEGVEMVVRAHHDRRLVDGGQLFEAAAGFGAGFVREVFVAPRGPGDKGRTARVRVRAGSVKIARPHTAEKGKDPASLTLGFVEVIEIAPPAGKGVKPVVWRIITTLPVEKPHEVDRIVRIYRLRWRIEQLFRTMKSDGLRLADSQLEAAHRLFKLSALALVAAARIIMLVDARDGGPRPASDLIASELIEPVAAIARSLEGKTKRQQNHHPKGSLAWLAWAVARLGGWNCYYKPPGPKTMAAGWPRLVAMLHGYKLAAAADV